MSASRYLRVAAAIPLALVGVGQIAVAQAQSAAVDAAPAPVQLLELTTPAGETTELAEAGLSEKKPDAASDTEVPAGTAEGHGVSPARASLLAAVTDVPDLEQDADLLTEPLEVDGFLVAGFTWSGSEDLPVGTQIYLRVRENGVWSSWYLNEAADAGPDDASGNGGTDEFVTGGADAIQAAVVSGGRALPTDLTLALVPAKPAGEEVLTEDDVTTTEAEPTEIAENTAGAQEQPVDRLVDATQSVDSATTADEGEGDAETTGSAAPAATSAGSGVNLDLPTALAATTTANGLPVPVVTRAEWGANQAYMTWSPKYANAAHVVVHHTAGTNNYTAGQSASIVAGIYYYHAVTLDWGDIGYNFLVDKYGQVFEGRYGTLSSAAGRMVIGGHARGANTGTMGISMMGNYVSTSPTDVQLDRVGKMAGWFLKRSGVTNAQASASFTILTTEKYKAGQVVNLPRILAHRDVGYTTCPGDVGYSKMGQIRAVAQEQVAQLSSADPSVVRAFASFAGSYAAMTGAATSGVTVAGQGYFQRFTYGVAYWTASAGVQFVGDPVLSAWGTTGWQDGPMGYPLTAGAYGPDGSRHQIFQGGIAYWSSTTPVSFLRGDILNAWADAGWESSSWGLPVSNEEPVAGGSLQRFQHGVAYRTSSSGVRFVGQAVIAAWGVYGWQGGQMGFPVGPATAGPGGSYHQVFQGGIAYWSPTTPVVFLSGEMLTAWADTGWESSFLGLPTSARTASAQGGAYQRFEHGVAYWTKATGVQFVGEPVLSAWGSYGWQEGAMGYPRTGGVYGPNGTRHQVFQGGIAYWSSTTSVAFVTGSIMGAWGQSGWESSPWGLPTGNEVVTSAGAVQTFQNGVATWTPSVGVTFTPHRSASTFQAGNIISDAAFFNAGAMSEAQVRGFLQMTNRWCQAGPDGTPCLKDYRAATTTVDTAYCAPYVGGVDEDAATIIAKTARACGVSPRVLLVLLQKEQGLVTASGSSLYSSRYTKAAGFACPDTSACNPTYAGFASQVYHAASRYIAYGHNASSFRFRSGGTYPIAYNPDARCGASPVTLANRATAALYNYTPYQPNAAALANMNGTGDSCSTYGNRNFWRIYTSWFGSTSV